MMAYYQEIASHRGGGGWRAVGEKIGCSGAYARQIAMGAKPVTLDIASEWIIAMGWAPKQNTVSARPSPKRQPRRFYRPCLPVELGEQVREWGIDVEAILTQAVKSAILDEQWRERTHEA